MQGKDPALSQIQESQDYYFYVVDKSLTSNQADSASLKIDTDSDFVLMAITGNRTGLFKAKITDNGPGRGLQNVQVEDVNFVGTAQNPNYLKHPHYFQRGSTVTIDMTDLSAAGNTIELALHGYRIFQPPIPSMVFKEIWFQYSTGRVTLNANQQKDFTIQTDSDADFLVQKIVGNSDQSGGYQIQVLDTDANKNWGSGPANSQNIVGTAQKPLYLPKARRLAKNSILVVTLKDTSGSSNTVEVVFEGYKAFK